MADYATIDDVKNGFRDLSETEISKATALISEAGVIIDAYNADASADVKKVVICRMIRRAVGEGDGANASLPIGATQASIGALGYSQSWTYGTGSSGELYLTSLEKRILGVGNRIGSHSPLEDIADD